MLLCGFVAISPDRRISAHWEMFDRLAEGDGGRRRRDGVPTRSPCLCAMFGRQGQPRGSGGLIGDMRD